MLIELPSNIIVCALGFLELKDVVWLDSASCSASARQCLHEAFELNSVDYGIYKGGSKCHALVEWLCKRRFRSNEISISADALSSFIRIPNYQSIFASYSDITLLGMINERSITVVTRFLQSLPVIQTLNLQLSTFTAELGTILLRLAQSNQTAVSLQIVDCGSGVLSKCLAHRFVHLLIDKICFDPEDEDEANTVAPHIHPDMLNNLVGFRKLSKLAWLGRSSTCLDALLEHSPQLDTVTIAGDCCTPALLIALGHKRLVHLDILECDRFVGGHGNPIAMPVKSLAILQSSRTLRTSCHHTLRSLRLEGIRRVDMEYRHLTGFVHLECLSLVGCTVRTAEIIPVLTAFPYFKLLELSYLTGLTQAFYASNIIRMRDDEELILAVDEDEFIDNNNNDDQGGGGLLSLIPSNNIESKVRMKKLELHLAHHDDLRDEAMVNQIFTMLCSIRSTLFHNISTFHNLRMLQLVEAPVRHFHLLNLHDCCPLLESLHLMVDPGNTIFPQVTFYEFPQRWQELKTVELLHAGCFPSGLKSLVSCGPKLKNVTIARVMEVSVEAWQLLLGTLRVEFGKVNIKLIPDLDEVVGPPQPLAATASDATASDVEEGDEEVEDGFEEEEEEAGFPFDLRSPFGPDDDDDDDYDDANDEFDDDSYDSRYSRSVKIREY